MLNVLLDNLDTSPNSDTTVMLPTSLKEKEKCKKQETALGFLSDITLLLLFINTWTVA